MAVFDNCLVLLELKTLPFKDKKKLKSAITENGGSILFVANKQCSLIVTGDVSNLSSNRLRSIQKYQTPVVGLDYVYCCLERGVLLPVDEYRLDISSALSPLSLSSPRQFSHEVPKVQTSKAAAEPTKALAKHVDSVSLTQRAEAPERSKMVLEKFRIYTETDSDLPVYPDHFQVAKYSIFEKINSNSWCLLELQSYKGENGRQYRVVRYWKEDTGKAAVRDMLVFLSTSEEALEVYKGLGETLQATGLQPRNNIPLQAWDLGSAPLQQLLLEEKLNTGSLSQEVCIFVELLWTEALGCLDNILRVPIDKLSLNDLSRVEGLLLQAQRKLRAEVPNLTETASLIDEVYTLLPHKEPHQFPPTAKFISQKLDLCQLIRDVLNVSEMTLRSPVPSCLGKYRALRCNIEAVSPGTSEFQAVTALLQDSKVQVRQVLRVNRGVELQTFQSQVGNIKPLLHSSSPSNFVGLLSRGLLLPRVGVEHHGVERTDAGNLGSGIYFSDAVSTSLKYSKPSETDGSRLLLVCDVALGRCRDVFKRDVTLTQAPEGHHSVHGVCRTPNTHSEFEDDEYVVYSPDQVKLKYVVQFSIKGDQKKEFSPAINTSAEPSQPSSDQGLELMLEDDEVESTTNPLEAVTAGLLDSAGQQLPLQAVHVKCKLMDLLSQVIIFQKYTNLSSMPIEAKYVFPLDDSAAVCGFEAFINGKHVVGQVKEKETARKEYKQAIEKGHGAYLMDQDAPDVFTISVGNLPAGATVLIKVTFVSELVVRDGSILFSLPGSVAPWQQSAALNQTTQVNVEKVCVTDEAREFTLDMSVEMPNEITDLHCSTHKVRIKKTDCKAVVSVLPGEVMGQDGFQLSVTLSEVHLPRMWVEKHPDKDSQASMLVFYPEFEVNSTSASDEVVLLLDTSESMKGESLCMAQRIARQVLKTLHHNRRINVVFFGTDHMEAFLTAQPLDEARQAAESFIKRSSPVGGSTELWRPLRALSLLPPSRGVRNLLLLSDGHIQNAELALRLVRDNAEHSRLFTCGLSPTANRHMLRALAQAGGGAFEYFDTKTKHNWAEKVACQVKRMASPGCSSVSVKWQQFNPTAPPPVQAPKQLHALFNDCHTLVYGFVPHCTQATLLGDLSGQELKTMVSTSELQKTRGTFLHKLTARALIRDYEDGSLDASESEHEGKKAELKRYIIDLSKEFSILSQFTSFVAIEERGPEQTEEVFTDIPKLIAEEDVDFLPYISWISSHDSDEEECGDEEYVDDMSDLEECSYGDEEYVDDMSDVEEGSCWDETRHLDIMEHGEVEESQMDLDFVVLDSISPPYSPMRADSSNLMDFEGSVAELGSLRSVVTKECLQMGFSGREELDMLPLLRASSCRLPPPPPPLFNQYSALSFPPPPPPPYAAFSAISHYPAPPAPPAPPGSGSSRSKPLFRHSVMSDVFSESLESPLVGYSCPKPLSQTSYSLESSAAEIPTLFGSSMHAKSAFPMTKVGGLLSQSVDICDTALSSHMLTECATGSPERDQSAWPATVHEAHSVFRQRTSSSAFAAGSGFTDVLLGAQHRHQAYQIKDVIPVPLDGATPPRIRRRKARVPEKIVRNSMPDADNPPAGWSFGANAQSEPKPVGGVPQAFGKAMSRPRSRGFSPVVYGTAQSAKSLSKENSYTSFDQSFGRKSADAEVQTLTWTKIFQMQHSEGFWELTTELGMLLNVNVDLFANVFLKNKGIQSLGVRAHADILRLLATLLVLQLMRVKKVEEGKLLRSLFCLDDSSLPRAERWEAVKRAVDWVCWADRQYPCVYSRLEFGLSWETSTRQLLGFEGLPPFSPLTVLNLQRTIAHLLVH